MGNGNLTGTRLDRYQVLEQLGAGGMAVVYRGHDTRLDRDVAIKIIRREAFPPEQLDNILKRFNREAKALANLSHPNIVSVYDYGEYRNSPYLVLEYLPGGTLKEMLKERNRLPWPEIVRLLIPVARALAYAHSHGIIHRDVKPSNILITESGEPMLTDFGIAKVIGGEEGYTLTTTGMAIGTPEYMAPEQWIKKEVDGRVDIYALGVVLYEAITGRKPYTAETPAALLMKQINESVPYPSSYIPGLPRAVEQVITKALQKTPRDRYRSMELFAEALEGLLSRAVESAMAESTGMVQPIAPTAETDRTIVRTELAKPGTAAEHEKRRELERLYREGKAAFERNDWETALKVFEAVVAEAPEYKNVSALLKQAKEKRRQRTGAKHRAKIQQRDGQPARLVRKKRGGMSAITQWAFIVPFFLLAIVVAIWGIGALRSRPVLKKTARRTATVLPAETITDAPVPTTDTSNLSSITPILPTDTPVSLPDTPSPGIGSTKIFPKYGGKMVYVPAGEFVMGSPDSKGYDDEHPQHSVYLDAFWIGETEVTNAQYERCVDADVCKLAGCMDDDRFNKPYQPVVCVSWYDAEKFCNWAGLQLPTEAQWEKAARGNDSRKYPWGNEYPDCDKANYSGCVGEPLAVGGRFAGVSPYGALDMAGNVWEWVTDWYGEDYYAHSPGHNPPGPDAGHRRVLRGGSFYSPESYVRCSYRGRSGPYSRFRNFGFRVVFSPSTSGP